MIYISIDPGVSTGVAVWDSLKQKFLKIITTDFWGAINLIIECKEFIDDPTKYNNFNHFKCKLIIEDTTKSKAVFGKYDRKAIVGIARRIGGLLRETELLILFCERNGIEVIRKVPNKKSMTKLNKEQFKQLTGWDKRTSSHSRDASMMVFKTK